MPSKEKAQRKPQAVLHVYITCVLNQYILVRSILLIGIDNSWILDRIHMRVHGLFYVILKGQNRMYSLETDESKTLYH